MSNSATWRRDLSNETSSFRDLPAHTTRTAARRSESSLKMASCGRCSKRPARKCRAMIPTQRALRRNTSPTPSLPASVKTFADSESALFAAAAGGVEAKFVEALRAVLTARKDLDDQVARASPLQVFAGGVSLTNAYQRFRVGVTTSAAGALGHVREVNEAALAANKDYPLFKDVKVRLDG